MQQFPGLYLTAEFSHWNWIYNYEKISRKACHGSPADFFVQQGGWMSRPSKKFVPQLHMASSTGIMLLPNGVSEYMVLGGLSGMTFLCIIPRPERILADQIYRTRENRRYCKDHGIRLSGPRLGRPSTIASASNKNQEYQDNTDRIEVERTFSLSKRCYGMGLIMTKLEETQLTTIALSVFVTNLFKIQRRIHFGLLQLCRFSNIKYTILSFTTV